MRDPERNKHYNDCKNHEDGRTAQASCERCGESADVGTSTQQGRKVRNTEYNSYEQDTRK